MNIFLEKYRKKMIYNQKADRDKIALKYMINCKKILDVGCGEGRFISNDPKRIEGIDQNEKSLKICQQKGYHVISGDVTQLPFKDQQFDAVHCAHVIEHLLPKEAYAIIKEIDRVLKPGGIFCLRTPMLHNGFYNDFTHVKPYHPEAILHYLESDGAQRTYDDMRISYKKIALVYRRQQLFAYSAETVLWAFYVIFNVLHRFGINNPKKTGYMLIMKKNA